MNEKPIDHRQKTERRKDGTFGPKNCANPKGRERGSSTITTRHLLRRMRKPGG